MDIQGWLQGTADRAPPNQSDEPDALNLVRAAHVVETARVTRYHQKRQRAATDSSIIAPRQKASNRSKVAAQSAGAGRGRHVHQHSSGAESASRGESSRLASQEHRRFARMEQPDTKTYERRARHKTKPDRYEPKTTRKGQRKRRGSVDERKPKRKSRRADHGGDGKRTESLVQGFRLKNRPPNGRLTLKPDVGSGMFRHGRASAQMTGRSNGLPDLAFNELRFLQESNELQDEQNPFHENMGKSRKQDRKRDTEREEISAYFDQRNLERDSAPVRRTTRKQNLVVDDEVLADHEDVMEEGSSPRLPDGELPAVPYLGFGSKGASKGNNPPLSTTSHLTWPESGDDPAKSGKRKLAFEASLEVGQLTVPNPTRMRRSPRDVSKILANDIAEGPSRNRIDVSKRQRATSGRIRVPEIISVYTDLDVTGLAPSTGILRDSKSQSLPTERPKKSTGDQRTPLHAADLNKVPSSGNESFHTSDILKIRGRLQRLAEPLLLDSKSTHKHPPDKENVPPPSSSSPTAKMLRTAHGAMMQHQLEMSVQSPARIRQSNVFNAVEREHVSNPSTGFRCRLEFDSINLAEQNFEHPVPSSAYSTSHDVEQQAWQDMHGAYDEAVEPEEETLDTYGVSELQPQNIAYGTGDYRYAYDYSTPIMRSDLRFLSRQHHRPSTRERDTPWSRSDIEPTRGGTSLHATLTKRDTSIRGDRVVDQEFDNGLEGFWRPNRLY